MAGDDERGRWGEEIEEGWEALPDEDQPEDLTPPAEVAAVHVRRPRRRAHDPGAADVAWTVGGSEEEPWVAGDDEVPDVAGRWPVRGGRRREHEPDLEEILEAQHYAFPPEEEAEEPQEPAEPDDDLVPREGERAAGRSPGGAPSADADPDAPGGSAALSEREAAELLDGERARLTGVRAGVLAEGLDTEETESLAELADVDQHPAEVSSETYQREVDASVLASIDAELADVEAAMARLAAHTYGRCERCGRPIPADRLRAVPATRWCLTHDVQASDERA